MAGTKKKPYGIGNITSWGATVVIIGLMFKILHMPGSTIFITVGLVTEAILFFIIGFQREHEEIDWTRAYPELADDYKGELPAQSSRANTVAAAPVAVSNTAALDKMLSEANIGPELIDSLGTGLRTFGDTVATISSVAEAGTVTTEFTTKLKAASASYDDLNNAFARASANLNDMAESNIDSKTYHEQVNSLAKNLSALNAVYELELQDSSAHLKSMNKFYEGLSMTMQNFNESLEDTKHFKQEVNSLAKNMASLNSVYGNMLAAMNQPRA